ncbi:MAG: hypothetical protein QNI87_06945 [Erythrobacter sp.]|uniref:hypothetical protein n=1 Tax=Erythrobacter sp. TaxID=1042 RepID=UPI0026256B7E|nr:hypothetical protein [Erythrobacter sp.]MDJ0978255.1 hypothetical protein [Erythrobacter sp.]
MSRTLSKLSAFIEDRREALEERALVRFETGEAPQEALSPAAKADAFAQRFGFQPIGFNWEMLDPGENWTVPRSARATMVEALATDISDRKTLWLGDTRVLQCAEAFLGAFAPSERTIVTNQLNGLWYPISGAADEWSFVGFDDAPIALLVLVPRV